MLGPSPRMRGSPDIERRQDRGGGSIPPCAGEPPSGFPATNRRRVHPRVCEAAWTLSTEFEPKEVHPHAPGGSRVVLPEDIIDVGSIPARAGEPEAGRRGHGRPWVHPRACGGAEPAMIAFGSRPGPSPRVRGSPWGVTCRTTSQFQTAVTIYVNPGGSQAHHQCPPTHERVRGG